MLNRLKGDESLMLAYQQGDSSAFESLYKRHKDGLFAFLYRSCWQEAVVEELAQDAWMSVINKAGTYQPTAKFKTYLYQIAHNKLVDHWRRSKNFSRVALEEADLASNDTSVEDQRIAEQRLQSLGQAIHKLPGEQRDVFLLREEGFSQEQIAQIVGVGKETVKSRLRYASNHLRTMLEESIQGMGDPASAKGAEQ